MAKCKDCVKKDVSNYRAANIEKVKEYDRNRPNAHERAENQKARYKKFMGNKDYRDAQNAHKRAHYAKNTEKKAANVLLIRAVNRGDVVRPNECSVCGATGVSIHGHHGDYTKPLDVIWCCPKCHGAIHREINRLKRNFNV